MHWLIIGIVLVISSSIGLILQIQNIKERWELEAKLEAKSETN